MTADEPKTDAAREREPVEKEATAEQDAQRPVLKAKPVGSRTDADAAKAAVRAGTLYAPDETPAAPSGEQPDDERAMMKTIVMPPLEERDPRFLYATHRPPPPEEESAKPKAPRPSKPAEERQVSAGFLLGTALIVVVLVGGIWIARLSRKVTSLEQRISSLEGSHTGTMVSALGRP